MWQGTRKFAPLIARSLRSIVEVAGPTMPSGLRRWARWNTRTAVSVPPPNFPSGSNCGVAPSALRSICGGADLLTGRPAGEHPVTRRPLQLDQTPDRGVAGRALQAQQRMC